MKHLIKRFLFFVGAVFSSKVAIIFVLGHLALTALALTDTYIKYGTLSEISGHIFGQTLLITVLMYINVPAALVSLFVSLPLEWIFAQIGGDLLGRLMLYFICFLCINFQWALIGYGVDKLFQRKVK